MKKGYDVFVISLVIITLLAIVSVNVSAYTCVDKDSETPCVCGHSPNSTLGYGQVILGGGLNYSCDNTANDNFCPEDYQDAISGVIGNCSSCTDIDCTVMNLTGEGYIWGYVQDSKGTFLEKADIVGSPSKWNMSASLERNTTTQYIDGYVLYNYSGFLTGKYSFKVSKSGYDTAIVPVTVTRGGIQQINFTLENGTCHDDCTNSYGRCNINCHNLSFGGGRNCSFKNSTDDKVTVSETMSVCNNVLAGKTMWIKTKNETHSWYVDCCEGIPYPKYNAKADTSENDKIKNMIKIEKIVRYGYDPSRLIIAYWR